MLRFASLYWDKSTENIECEKQATVVTPSTPLAWLHASSLQAQATEGWAAIPGTNGYMTRLVDAWGAAPVGAYAAAPSAATLSAVRAHVRSSAFVHLAVDGLDKTLDAPQEAAAGGLMVWATEEGESCAVKVSCSDATVVVAWSTRDPPCFGAGMGLSSSLTPAQLRQSVLSMGKETWRYLIDDEED